MNRFVIVLGESYDCYSAMVHHPVETAFGREEIRDAFATHVRRVNEWFASYSGGRWNPPYDSGPLLDTGLSVHLFEAAVSFGTTPQSFRADMEILTVDEWFARYANRRFNQEGS